jgi:hypothetical protein
MSASIGTRAQEEQSSSGSASAYRQPTAAPAIAPDPFEDGLRKVARALRDTIPDLADREYDFLCDIAREETRYPMPTVRKLCALARRSRQPIVRIAFAELIRLECLPETGTDVGVTSSFDLELRANGPTDIAQRNFERDRNPITYARAKSALEHQIATSELALLSVVRWGRQHGLEAGQERTR